MPATSGTEARKGPKKRPMKIASAPQRFTNASSLYLAPIYPQVERMKVIPWC
jgi:hypothetical protein